MQDYPKSLPADAAVGFCVVHGTTTFSPVKTNLADARKKSAAREPTYSAPSGELDMYRSACEMLAAAGVQLPPPVGATRAGIALSETPRVVVAPSFGVTIAEWRAKLPTPAAVSLAAGSTLVLDGHLAALTIESLALQGALVVRVCRGAKVTIRKLRVANAGWAFEELAEGEAAPEQLAIRGYRLARREQRELVFDAPGEYVVDE